MKVIKVAATSRTSSVAGAIAGILRDDGRVEVQAIGATAVNQTLKALITARRYLRLEGIELRFQPKFIDALIKGKERTVIQFVVESVYSSDLLPYAPGFAD
ncbi:MAG: stage V sporulation protein S [Anaerolineae bacterium]|nr:stage V sporulation protein S [Anaerolineae bacterium]